MVCVLFCFTVSTWGRGWLTVRETWGVIPSTYNAGKRPFSDKITSSGKLPSILCSLASDSVSLLNPCCAAPQLFLHRMLSELIAPFYFKRWQWPPAAGIDSCPRRPRSVARGGSRCHGSRPIDLTVNNNIRNSSWMTSRLLNNTIEQLMLWLCIRLSTSFASYANRDTKDNK